MAHDVDLTTDLNAQDDDGQAHFSILPGGVAKNRHRWAGRWRNPRSGRIELPNDGHGRRRPGACKRVA